MPGCARTACPPCPITRWPPPSGTWCGRAGGPTTRSLRCGPCWAPGGRWRPSRTRCRSQPPRPCPPPGPGTRPWWRAPFPSPPPAPGSGPAWPRGAGQQGPAAAAAERLPEGGFAALYPVLRAMEETGRCRRGYFVEGLGAAQFALPGAVDRLRAIASDLAAEPAADPAAEPAAEPAWLPAEPSPEPAQQVRVLAATDPSNAYGAALPWPPRPDDVPGGHKPGRKAGALVILVGGDLVLYVERGGRTLLSWTSD